jgi:3'-phosphoadenosine 5'-phosphosulfate sulfotransferase (PAPS reductase)/FAD synthetase
MGGERSPPNTRMRFPQVTASLQQRWCSSSIKIEVGDRYLCNNPRFADGQKRLVVTGERAEESSARATYAVFEPNRKDNRSGTRVKRWLDHWRPVHAWSEQEVWAIIERHRVAPHPVYHLGLSRASCAFCIFGGAGQWSTLREIDRPRFEVIAGYEKTFGVTIHRSKTVVDQANAAEPLVKAGSAEARAVLAAEWVGPMILPTGEWTLPRGAFGKSGGPT